MHWMELPPSRLKLLPRTAALVVLLAAMSLPAAAQTITSLNPSTVTAGGPGFTLTVTGSGFAAGDTVLLNSSARPSTFVTPLQMTATVFASDIAAPASLNISVTNGGGTVSPSATLFVVAVPSPTLVSVSPALATQGAQQISLTLVGTNFRPGATVVISPPVTSLAASNANARATDITLLGATVVNSTVMTAQFSVSPNAVAGLRAINILNLDGTNTAPSTTGPGSPQPLNVSPANSFGAPLSVLNLALMHPRDGTVVMQGEDLYAEAVLAGTGTGTVIGQWLWDGNVVEQFSATLVGGQSTAIRTRQSLPTWSLGAHTLQLQMIQPNQSSGKPAQVVVNPGTWKLEQLLQPAYGAVFAANAPPHLVWAIVPGALKYQVAFTTQPFFNSIDHWSDVTDNDWQVPLDLWNSLPTGQLYWTVRTIDAPGQPRKPLPLRVIFRSPGTARLYGNRFRRLDANYTVRDPPSRTISSARFTLLGDVPPPTPSAATLQQTNDAEAPPAAPQPPNASRAHPSEDGQVALNTQWASASNPADSSVLSLANHILYQQGAWKLELNGSGLLNSLLNAPTQRTSQGKFNDYVLQLGYQQPSWQQRGWGAFLRFGIVSPVLYSDAQFISEATPRLAAELALKTPAGVFSGFANTNDAAAGGGYGISVHQSITGASWQAPLPQRAQFRVMFLNAADVGVIGSPVASGNVYGALLNVHLSSRWLWSSEYAVSHDNPDTSSATSVRAYGRAWRTGLIGQAGKASVNLSYRDVTAHFGNPTNPGLTPNSQPNVRGLTLSIALPTQAGNLGLNYSLLANNAHPVSSDELLLNTTEETWSKPIHQKTNFTLDARQSLTTTGTVPLALVSATSAAAGAADMRDLAGTINISRQVGNQTLSLSAQRDWNHNTLFPTNSTITSSLSAGVNLVTHGVFQMNSQTSVNWVAADGFTAGTSRSVSFNLQPALVFKHPALQLAPLLTVTQAQTLLSSGTFTADTLTGQYGGRMAWTLPGVLKHNVLSAQGNYNQNRNSVTGLNQPTAQLFALLTTTWGHKHTF